MTTHKGSCHCGKVAYEVDADFARGMECNCSMCARRGGLLAFVPESAFRLLTPRDDLGSYKFNKHAIDHHFCTACGVAPFSEGRGRDGNAMIAINLRCIEGLDPKSLAIDSFDGRAL